jgi:SNF2 family DNA or RNA helicase
METSARKIIPTLDLKNGKFQLACTFVEREVANCISNAKWNPTARAWEYPVNPYIYQEIIESFPRLYIDPETETAIKDMLDNDHTVSEMKAQGWENVAVAEPMPLKTIPFNHQILAFNIGIKLPNTALLMEQGCGKSLTAVAIAGRRFLRGEIKQVLVAAPASVVPVWPSEFGVHGDFKVGVWPLTGSTADKVKQLAKFKAIGLKVLVNNYESIWRMEKELGKWIKAAPTMIICDESQRIKNPSAEQSKALHRLGKFAAYRMILTGTPVCNSPLDFFSQYKFLDQSIFGQYVGPFRARYAVEVRLDTQSGGTYKKVVGYTHLNELKQKAHSIAFRCTKAECLDLPEQIDQTLYCELEPKAASYYNQLSRESIAELDDKNTLTAINILSKLLRLAQMAGGYLNIDGEVMQVSAAKIKLLEETLDDFLMGAGKKVVIFGRFIPEIAAIRRFLEKKQINYRYIAGDVKLEDRGTVVNEFQTDPEVRVFVAQIQCAGLGITLTAADTAIFYSLDFSYANYAQCRARIHRIGQKNNCTYIHLVAKNTVDQKVLKALQEKRDVAADTVDKWRELFKKDKEETS